jgi:hypothetical protein
MEQRLGDEHALGLADGDLAGEAAQELVAGRQGALGEQLGGAGFAGAGPGFFRMNAPGQL